ncbi:MAG: choice-of-anchor tandem repeat GloVer-containing protein [Luteolibacter sp.]
MIKNLRRQAMLLAMALGTSSALAAVAQFDITDKGTSSPALSGWTSVTGSADNADSVTGTDGTHTLTLSTSGDGQDRDRGTAGFTADANFWRDFWFVANSTIGGQTATATITGLTPNTSHIVEIWAYDTASTGNRAMQWTDAVSGNTGASSFNGATTPVPASLGDCVATVLAKTNGSGVITLTGAAASGGSTGLPNVFVTGLRVSEQAQPGTSLPTFEAESGTLGSDFLTSTVSGAACITISTNSTVYNPVSANRVATYSVPFPAADTYQLYARVLVGAGNFADDSFFYGNGFGTKSATTDADWVAVVSGLNTTGFTNLTDPVTVNGGAAGIQVWKWIRFGTSFTVSGSLTKTFQIGGREDGFSMDKFAFAPAGVTPTVAQLDTGFIPDPPSGTGTFDGPDGIAFHRFSQPNLGATPDGANPATGLVLLDGLLCGTTQNGGLQGEGAAFRMNPDGSGFETLESFYSGSDAAFPQGGLVISGAGFFGLSQAGGTYGTGTVFERRADGTIAIIRSFNAVAAHTAINFGGASPSGPLAISGSTLYGAASAGGANGNGAVFSASTSGSAFTVLRDFSAIDSGTGTNIDGALPCGGVIVSGGKIYGTTSAGGSGGTGVVFSMDASGSNFTVLHSFTPMDAVTAANADGALPSGGLALSNDILYGTTLAGGAGGKGTVFAINTNGSDFLAIYQFSAIDPLTRANTDGASPAAVLSLSGNVLYGTTSAGGSGAAGTVFALDPFVPRFRTFHSFQPLAADGTNTYGAFPVAPLLRVGNALFGTAFGGGPGGSGTVFRIPIPLSAEIYAIGNPNGTVNATLSGLGAPYSNYRIQATNNLSSPASWQDITTQATDAGGFLQYSEANLNSPGRFYRMREAP